MTERAAEDRAAAKSSRGADADGGGGRWSFSRGPRGGERRVARLGREFGEHREGVDAEVNEGEECVGRERKARRGGGRSGAGADREAGIFVKIRTRGILSVSSSTTPRSNTPRQHVVV